MPVGCDWDAIGMSLGCSGTIPPESSPGQRQERGQPWRRREAEAGCSRTCCRLCLQGERHCASRCAGAAALGALPAAPGAAIVPLLPFSARGCPRPHCSCRKLALKTHPKPPRPSTAGDCYWPQLPPLCLITSIWGCGKM